VKFIRTARDEKADKQSGHYKLIHRNIGDRLSMRMRNPAANVRENEKKMKRGKGKK
jgi:hypothetical protein